MDRSLTKPDVAVSAAEIAVMAAERAVEAESARTLAPEMVAALRAGGFARHFVPAECGGAAGTFQELADAIVTIGEACAATAWCASLAANLSRMAAFLPAEGYREIWADGPDAIVVGSLIPSGKGEPAEGGWRISGRWPYVSGIDFADWVLVCGNVEGEARVFAVPKSSCTVLDTWLNVGMRATGSNTVVVKDLFVPVARSFRRENLFTGRAIDSSAPCHSVPLQTVNGLSFALPVLGAARGALSSWSTYITQKLSKGTPAGPGLTRAVAGARVGRRRPWRAGQCPGHGPQPAGLLTRGGDADRRRGPAVPGSGHHGAVGDQPDATLLAGRELRGHPRRTAVRARRARVRGAAARALTQVPHRRPRRVRAA